MTIPNPRELILEKLCHREESDFDARTFWSTFKSIPAHGTNLGLLKHSLVLWILISQHSTRTSVIYRVHSHVTKFVTEMDFLERAINFNFKRLPIPKLKTGMCFLCRCSRIIIRTSPSINSSTPMATFFKSHSLHIASVWCIASPQT